MNSHKVIDNFKYNSIIPKPFKLFTYIDKTTHKNNGYYSITFYINDKFIKICEVSNTIGYVHSIIDEPLKEITIISIHTNKKYRNKGIAQFLFISLCSYIKNKITTILLDDMSNNAWMKNNLYINLGMKYINEYPEPEMIGDCKIISEKFNKFKNKYNNKGFFININ